jgi:CheY-like chemotaxis protein
MSSRVLIVEDNEGTREAMALLLQAAGYTTAEAGDGRSALNVLRQKGPLPRLIFLDLMMPGMNGWEFLRERRNEPELASVPVVLFTAAGGLDPSAAWALGANDVLHKPANPDDLLAAAGRYC